MTKINSKEVIEKITTSPIFISFIVFFSATFVVYRFTISKVQGAYNDTFIRDVLVEAHGMLFDILVIGTFIFALRALVENRREKKRAIQRWQEEIDDFRYWKSEEAKFRIIGNIKRLNRNGITRIDLGSCYLKGAFLSFINLQGASFSSANLQGAYLESDNLQGADFKDTDLQDLDLSYAEIQGVKNLTIRQLSKVKTLYKAKLDPELEKQLKEKYLNLLEKPKEEEE